jgi:hypothetical protein
LTAYVFGEVRSHKAILRVDGDTGTLSGNFKDGKFFLSHFTGERPFFLEVTPQSDSSLQLQVASFLETPMPPGCSRLS